MPAAVLSAAGLCYICQHNDSRPGSCTLCLHLPPATPQAANRTSSSCTNKPTCCSAARTSQGWDQTQQHGNQPHQRPAHVANQTHQSTNPLPAYRASAHCATAPQPCMSSLSPCGRHPATSAPWAACLPCPPSPPVTPTLNPSPPHHHHHTHTQPTPPPTPQIGYSTVFFCEYAGPMVIYPLFFFFPQVFYYGQR
jgi:hypothetical protein